MELGKQNQDDLANPVTVKTEAETAEEYREFQEFQEFKRQKMMQLADKAPESTEWDAGNDPGHAPKTKAMVIYCLYLGTFFLPFLAVIGLIIALVSGRSGDDKAWESHYRYQGRTFVYGVMLMLMLPLSIFMLGYVISHYFFTVPFFLIIAPLVLATFASWIWWIYRNVIGMVRLSKGSQM